MTPYDLSTAENYRRGATFMLLTVWICLHSLFHTELCKKVIHGKLVHCGHSGVFTVIFFYCSLIALILHL